MPPLSPGSRLGPYEILSLLGSGGMGAVYKATDTRLRRTVAIKVLRNEGGERTQRLQREARAIAALNHPRICTVYDTGSHQGVDFLVMEHLEGETLADRLARGPLPLATALRYGAQIADALAAAHRAGVVHRDLKPANVMLTRDSLKLLDFGIATEAAAANADARTVTTLVTRPGLVMGTFHYMAPEQLEGRTVDTRADIWAFGCVLYEMLTGVRAFDGASTNSVIAAVLTSEPPQLPRLAAELPVAVSRLLRACLERDPEHRWQSAGDLARELRWLDEPDVETRVDRSPAARQRFPRWLRVAAGAAALVTAAVAGFLAHRPEPRGGPARHVAVPFPSDLVVSSTGGPYLSPDGRRLLVVGERAGQRMLCVREMSGDTFEPIEGTGGATFPFWAPDGDQIGFFADRRLKKVSLKRRAVETVADAANPRGGAWSSDGTILFNPAPNAGLWRVPASGGTPTELTRLAAGQRTHRFPAFLPDGRHFLFTISPQTSTSLSIAIGSLGDGTFKELVPDASDGLYAAGRLWFVRNRSLFAQPFSPATLGIEGQPVNVVRSVGFADVYGHADVSIADDGTVAFMTGGTSTRLAWFDRSGKVVERVAETPAIYSGLWTASPDGGRVAYVATDSPGQSALIVTDLRSGVALRVMTAPDLKLCLAWSPNGDRIAAAVQEGDEFSIVAVSTRLSQQQRLLRERHRMCPLAWTADGRSIIVVQARDSSQGSEQSLLVAPLEPGAPRTSIPAALVAASGALAISPDGRWMAHVASFGNRTEAYLQRFPPDGRPVRFTSDQVFVPRWRADGGELFYEDQAFDIRAVRVTQGKSGDVSIGAPTTVLKRSIAPKGAVPYAISPDGQRILTTVQEGGETSHGVSMILNVTTLLAESR